MRSRRPHSTLAAILLLILCAQHARGQDASLMMRMMTDPPVVSVLSVDRESDSTFAISATFDADTLAFSLRETVLKGFVMNEVLVNYAPSVADSSSTTSAADAQSNEGNPLPFMLTDAHGNKYSITVHRSEVVISSPDAGIPPFAVSPSVLEKIGSVHRKHYPSKAAIGIAGGYEDGWLRYTINDTIYLWELLGGAALLLFGFLGAVLYRSHRIRRASAAFRQRIVHAREEERSRLAGDLHDGPIQDIYHALLLCRMDEEGRVEADLHRVTAALRDICSELRPPVLTHLGLPTAVATLADDLQQRFPDIAFHADVDARDPLPLGEAATVALYRAIQEATSNVLKHANAKNVWITLTEQNGSVVAEVRDDGRGFNATRDWAKLEEQGHLGLSLASQRAEGCGGRFTITSRRGRGTTVRMSVPLVQRRGVFRGGAFGGGVLGRRATRRSARVDRSEPMQPTA